MSKRDQNISTKIAEIRRIATQELPNIMAAGYDDATEKRVQEQRYNMDSLIIQVVLGADFAAGKTPSEQKIKYTQKMPSLSQLTEITDVLGDYIRNHEVPYYAMKGKIDAETAAALQSQTGQQAPDMSIPGQAPVTTSITVDYPKITALENVTKKDMKSILFNQGIIRKYLDVSAVMTLASMGDTIRKKQNLTWGLIIGGITLAAAAGTVTAIYIYNKKKEEELDEVDDDLDVIDLGADPLAISGISDDVPGIVEIA